MVNNQEMKRIEDTTRCQVTFSKRRSNLIRKANEISVFCDVDVALVAFSPSGRVSKFCSRERMEDVLERYVKLPPDKRYQNVRCLEWKLQRLRQLDYMKGDEDKLLYLDNQIKNVELQIKKTTIEIEILQTNLNEYEPVNEEDASLDQILWCEKNLKNTLQQIQDRKKMMLVEMYPSPGQTRPQRPQGQIPSTYKLNGNQVLNRASQDLTSSIQYLMQHDPRTCPYSSRVHIGLLDQQHQTRGIVGVPGASCSYAFNPLAGGNFPAIYHPGHPSLTQQTDIPPNYPPIQHPAFYWGKTAPCIQNLPFRVFGNSFMHQPVIGNLPTPFVPYQPLGALGASNLYQPIMPGIVDQQLGVLGSLSAQQQMGEDQMAPAIPERQPGALGDSFLDQSLMGDSAMTPYVKFQAQRPTGALGSTSVERHANDGTFGAQENHTPTSYHNYNHSNTQNDASLPLMSQLQVDPDELILLCSPTQNLDVTPFLNSKRVSSEPFFTNDVGSITTSKHEDGDNINNGISGGNNTRNYNNDITGYCDSNGKHPVGATQESPPPESTTDSMFLNSLLNEAMLGNDTTQTEGNEEGSSIEWDGFSLAENLNLEDLDLIF